MLILAGQDVYKLTIDKLREWGHNVVTVKELGMERASDEELLEAASEANRLLITRDKGFGALIFLKEKISIGIVLLGVRLKQLKKFTINFRNLCRNMEKMN